MTFARCKSVFSIELSLWSLTNDNKPSQPNEPIRARGKDMLLYGAETGKASVSGLTPDLLWKWRKKMNENDVKFQNHQMSD